MKNEKILISCLIMAGLVLSEASQESRAFAQEQAPATADSVIQETIPDSTRIWLDRACTALGGIEAVKAVTSITSKVVLVQTTTMGDMIMDGELVVVYPDRFRASLTTPYGSIQMVLTGDDAWMVVPNQGAAALNEYQKKMMVEAQLRDAVVLFSNRGAYQIRHAGRRSIFGMEVVDLEARRGEYLFHIFLNPSSGLIEGFSYAESGPQGPTEKEERSSEYQTVNGYQVPMKSEVFSAGKKESETRISECRVNTPYEESWFRKP
jgi:hypothetical protein